MSLRNPERGLFSVKGLIYSLGLLASFVSVGVLYGAVIRPAAERAAIAAEVGVEAGGSFSSLALILKDVEQQICLTLFLWGAMILIYKFFVLRSEAGALALFSSAEGGAETEVDFHGEPAGIGRERAGELARKVDEAGDSAALRDKVLPYVLARGLQRYHLTGSVPEATETVMGRLETAAEQQESELSMLRYLVWAIPSIGFIGTVRGIGLALRRADEALQGDIAGVTAALGTAFNSTLVALIISIFLMLLIHLLQANQEGMVLRLQTFCREQVIDRLFDHPEAENPPEPEPARPGDAGSPEDPPEEMPRNPES